MIRKSKEADNEKMLSIWLASSQQSLSFVGNDYWQNMMPIVKKYYLPNTDSFVFEDKRQIKGFVSIIDDKYIGGLFVDPKFQKQKVGSKLLNYVKKIYPELSLKVFAKNTDALRFYQSNGFKIVAEQIDDSTKEEELLMSWCMECKTGFAKRHPEDS